MKKFLLPFLSLLLVSSVRAETRDASKFTDEAEAAAKQLRERIQAEVAATPGHPWAGEYYMGDGLGVNVSVWIAPKAGYVFHWHGCLGLYDRNYGAVTESNGVLRLSFTFPNEQKGFQGIAGEFVLVPWGERRYLIPTGELAEFCNSYNSGRIKFRSGHDELDELDFGRGRHLVRVNDGYKKNSGLPEVPEAWRNCLLAEPITAAIIKIGETTRRPSRMDWEFLDHAVTLDAGKDKGVFKGMGFYFKKHAATFTITEVGETTSQAVLTRFGDDDSTPPPKNGWQLTTKLW